jgi:hypothetical protein
MDLFENVGQGQGPLVDFTLTYFATTTADVNSFMYVVAPLSSPILRVLHNLFLNFYLFLMPFQGTTA